MWMMDAYTTSPNVTIGSSDHPRVDHDETYYLSLAREHTIQTVYMCISMVGIPANLLALIAIASSPKMRAKPFNMLIIHQSSIDLCACSFAFGLQVLHPSYEDFIG